MVSLYSNELDHPLRESPNENSSDSASPARTKYADDQADSLGLYLEEIARTALLKPAEEYRLAVQMDSDRRIFSPRDAAHWIRRRRCDRRTRGSRRGE